MAAKLGRLLDSVASMRCACMQSAVKLFFLCFCLNVRDPQRAG